MENSNKLILTNFRPLIKSFYKTDNISSASATMRACNLPFKEGNNFIKRK